MKEWKCLEPEAILLRSSRDNFRTGDGERETTSKRERAGERGEGGGDGRGGGTASLAVLTNSSLSGFHMVLTVIL